MKMSMNRILIIIACLSLLPALVQANSVAAAERMKERLSQIDSLKKSGNVGENAAGFLEIREAIGERETALVKDENEDRKVVYAEVAARTGQSAVIVGEQRALRIAELANKGIWLKKKHGHWYQKE